MTTTLCDFLVEQNMRSVAQIERFIVPPHSLLSPASVNQCDCSLSCLASANMESSASLLSPFHLFHHPRPSPLACSPFLFFAIQTSNAFLLLIPYSISHQTSDETPASHRAASQAQKGLRPTQREESARSRRAGGKLNR